MPELPPSAKSVVVGTAGHIDHGKTALVRALTGIDTDRLPEEKRRGITIDLGFASVDMQEPGGASLRISFIDVPGHHAFVRNMMAGTGGIDCVMLVISAEEGVKPQTEEHLAICDLLGVKTGITVLTKTDAVEGTRLQKTCAEVSRYLQGTFLREAPVVPVSAHMGDGMARLRAEIAGLASGVPQRSSEKIPRLPLDRVFAMRGFGTVVTGTLSSGVIQRGEMLTIAPGSRAVRVRGVQVHGREVNEAAGGSRVALNLAGVAVADVQRGHTLVPPSTLDAVNLIDVELTLLPDAPASKKRSRLRFHAFTSETLAGVSLYDRDSLHPGETALARINLSKEIVLLPGDRFVLRQCSPAKTIGGGRVLDAHPLRRARKAASLGWLEQLLHASPERELMMRVERRGAAGMALEELVAEMGIASSALRKLAGSLLADKHLVCVPEERLLSGRSLQETMSRVLAEAKDAGDRWTNGTGLKRAEIKNRTGLSPEILDLVLDSLAAEKRLELSGELVRALGSGSHVGDDDSRRLAQIAELYSSAGLTVPLLQTVGERFGLKDAELRRLMTLLLREKTLIKLGGDDIYMHRDVLAELYTRIRSLRGQSIDIADFKQITGASRKYAIPLLEHLDRERITRRVGEARLVL